MTKKDMAQRCDYHHENPPSWICSGCRAAFCDKCIPYGHSRHWGKTGPRCPLCNKDLYFQHPTEDAPPFWTQLPQFFSYPLHPKSLTTIGLIALASVMVPWLSILAVVLIFFLLVLTVKYSFQIIESRAENNTTPPSITEILEKDQHNVFFKMIVVVIVLYGGSYLVSAGNQTTFSIINGIVTFILPAVTIILAIEKSVYATLNPLNILSFILRIGWVYLLVCLCYQVVSSGPNVIFLLLPESLSLSISTPIIVAISLYFLFTAHCMLGYIVYQYQGNLGHHGQPYEVEDIDKEEFDKRRILAEAYITVREANINGARAMIRPLLDRYKNDIELHGFFHKILLLTDDQESIKNHANYYIRFLTDEGNHRLAAKAYEETLSKLPSYQPDNIDAAYQIAKVFQENGKKKSLIKVLNNLHKLNSRDPTLPSAYFLLAKNYSEYMNRDDQALRIIDFILDKFPDTDMRKAIIEYRKVLVGMR